MGEEILPFAPSVYMSLITLQENDPFVLDFFMLVFSSKGNFSKVPFGPL